MKKSLLLFPIAIFLVMSLFLVSCEGEPELKTYKVTFLIEKGDTTPYDEKVVLEGSGITEAPKDPTKDGCDFLYWKLIDGETEYKLNTPVKSDITLIAEWKTKEYTVSFMVDGAKIEEYSQIIKYGETAKEPKAPEKDGYTFQYWSLKDSKEKYDFAEAITDNVTLVANWDINEYTVTFMDGEEEIKEYSQVIKYGDKAKKPTNPEKNGHSFSCWKKVGSDSAFSFDSELITSNTVLEAVWDTNTYKVTFKNSDGTEYAKKDVLYNGKVEKPKVTPTPDEGFTFKHWATSAGSETEYDFNTPITYELVLYPVFEIKKCTVTFVGAEGIISTPDSQLIEYNKTATDSKPTVKEGYEFLGWKLEKSDLYFDFKTKITSDTTLYAVCRDTSKVLVSFYDGDRLLSSGYYKWGEDIEFPTFSDVGTGCTITKWKLTDDSKEYTDTFNLTYKEDGYRFNAYIEAQYLKIDSYGKVSSITNFNSTGVQSLVIPHSIKGIQVKGIEYNAFSGCSKIKSITIPDCVTFIGASAFYKCTGLTSITIPASVTSIEDTIFAYCSNLESINVSPENTSFSSVDGVWFDKDQKRLICFPAGKNGTEYNIPNTVKTIDRNAFSGCVKLIEVTIPESVTSIGYSAFSECTSLKKINVPGSVNSLSCTFKGCTSLENVEIENGVEKISNSAFESCTNLTSIDIPNSVTTIGDYVFSGCTGLTSITIPSSVTFIGKYTFLSSGLTSIDIPESVNSIGQKAFATTNLENITVSAGNSFFKSIDGILFDKNGLKIVCFPAGKTVDSYTIPDGVTSIGQTAFSNCNNLKNIVIPNSVTSIEGSAFTGSGLSSVVIPGSIESIESYAFNSCTNLTSVSLSSGVKYLSDGAFYNCTSLSNITISDTLESIGDNAFYNCTSLTSLSIPNSITTLGNNAFLNCKNLKEITINKTKDFIPNAPWGGIYYYDNGLSGNRRNKQFKIVWSGGTSTTY